MERIIERLPSPGGLALWLYAAAFLLLPALLAWKGLAYVIGVVIFAVGVRPHVEGLVAGRPISFAFHWRGNTYRRDFHLAIPSERWAVKAISWALILLTLLVLPVLVFVIQAQGQVFYRQLETSLPDILASLGAAIDYANEQIPGAVPDVEVQQGAGWQGLSNLFAQVAGDAVADVKSVVQSVFGSVLGVVATLLGDWVKLIIASLLVGTILSNWEKEVSMHRRIVSGGIAPGRLRENVLRFGEHYQTGVSLFMIGYLEVAATLSLIYGLAMVVLPLGLSVGAIVFIAIVLGFITAIPKIGSLLAMVVAVLLMGTNIEAGLGWFGYTVLSLGTGLDVLVRTGLLVGLAKILGLLEAYSYTPEIVGAKLGMTKMQIIATVMIWAVGAGFFGMIWGILISLTFQAALRLAEEDAARAALPDEPAQAAE
ncbi:MAG: hypothetical protein AAGI34_01705 [Pseudomonadota bacterium]